MVADPSTSDEEMASDEENELAAVLGSLAGGEGEGGGHRRGGCEAAGSSNEGCEGEGAEESLLRLQHAGSAEAPPQLPAPLPAAGSRSPPAGGAPVSPKAAKRPRRSSTRVHDYAGEDSADSEYDDYIPTPIRERLPSAVNAVEHQPKRYLAQESQLHMLLSRVCIASSP